MAGQICRHLEGILHLNRTLLVEVGGTHTRCAFSDGKIQSLNVFNNLDHPDLASVLSQYCAGLSSQRPTAAVIAVAAPVTGTRVRLTNLDWVVDSAQLKRQFALQQVRLVNDFAALACAIPNLAQRDLLIIQEGQLGDQRQNIAVIGPGTGLGTSGLVYCRDQWIPVCGEGGHVTLAAVDEREEKIVARLRERYGHVSVERVLSGPGLLDLYTVLSDSPKAKTPSDVSSRAEEGDVAALQALDLFFKFLGTASADLVLTLGARGGLYLGGGILPALRQNLEDSGFVSRFRAKGRYSSYLADIPVSLIVAENPALLGLNHYPCV